MRLEVLLASGEAIVEGLRVPGRGMRRVGGKWEQWGKCRARRGAQRQRRDGAGCSDGHGAGTGQGQDMVTQHTAVALAHTGGAGRRLMNTMANLVNKEVASGRHNGCYHN